MPQIIIFTFASCLPKLPNEFASRKYQGNFVNSWEKMCTAKALTEHYEANFAFVSKYVHATSRGHEAIQIAVGLQA